MQGARHDGRLDDGGLVGLGLAFEVGVLDVGILERKGFGWGRVGGLGVGWRAAGE